MLVRLTRAKRSRAGWFIALAYLFCVLAPTLSFAFPGSQSEPYCLTEDHVSGVVHVHSHHVDGEGMVPVHADGHAHRHFGGQTHADSSAAHDVKPAALTSDAGSTKAPHSANGKCCGLMCVTALPAADIDIAKPLSPKVVRVSEKHRKLTDNAPARLYRPPNS